MSRVVALITSDFLSPGDVSGRRKLLLATLTFGLGGLSENARRASSAFRACVHSVRQRARVSSRVHACS